MNAWVEYIREAYWDLRRGNRLDPRAFTTRLLRSVVDVRGVRVRINSTLPYSVVKYLLQGGYESSERTLIEGALHPDDIVMELGAGLGYISTICARTIGSSRVFAYEANARMEPLIRDTFRLNAVDPALHICMVGADAGTATFHVSSQFLSSSTVPGVPQSEAVTVPVVSLRNELERIRPTVLIVDIEGGEYELFHDFPPNACRLIMLELHPGVLGELRANQVLHWIEALGFRLTATAENSYLYERVAEPTPRAA